MLYGSSQNTCALVQLFYGNELIRSMRDAYIARAEDDRLGSHLAHLRRFRPESDCSGPACGCFFKEAYERGISRRLHPTIQPYDLERAIEIRVRRFFIINRRVD